MKIGRVASIIIGVVIISLAFILTYYYLPYSPQGSYPSYTEFDQRLIDINETSLLESKIPDFVWKFRGLDLLIQGLLIIAASSALALYFGKYKKEAKEEGG